VGTLYLVATPIGNLDDITLRALHTLESAPLIAAEDTRHTLRLLNHLGIHQTLVSYHDHNARPRAPWLGETLRAGQSVALVGDAGKRLHPARSRNALMRVPNPLKNAVSSCTSRL